MKRLLPLFVTLLLLGLLGCASAGNYMMVVPISNGGSVNILLTRDGPQNAEDDNVKVHFANFLVPEEKKVAYTFVFQCLNKAAVPTKVVIENVTEATPELLMEDDAPKLSPTGNWKGSITIDADINGNMAWLNHDTTTMRIYRFTITFADGSKSVLHQPGSVPPFVKPIIKERLGFGKPATEAAK